MSGFSRLLNRTTSQVLARSTGSILFNRSIVEANKQLLIQITRASHGRTMFIRPGKFYTKKYFDIIVIIVLKLRSIIQFESI